MRLSELLRSDVVTEDGRRLGPLRDLRLMFRARGDAGRPEILIDSALIGEGAFADRFGYGRGPVKGPRLVRVAMERLRRHELVVRLDERARIGEGRLLVPSGSRAVRGDDGEDGDAP